MLETYSIRELVDVAGTGRVSDAVLADQAERDDVAPETLVSTMLDTLMVMRASVRDGLQEHLRSVSHLTGGQAYQYMRAVDDGRTVAGAIVGRAAARALAVAEWNACMGRIVAAPTAGACGVVPGILLTLQEERGYTDDELAMALFAAAGVGRVIAKRASISGAQGGCQAEIGAATAMAAAAVVELAGGVPAMLESAVALSVMNLMGLVCDPVMGLVEVPCVYRNVAGVSVALTCADMALAGIRPILPADEVIDAMGRVGCMLPAQLRETGEGGCASCASGRQADAKETDLNY